MGVLPRYAFSTPLPHLLELTVKIPCRDGNNGAVGFLLQAGRAVRHLTHGMQQLLGKATSAVDLKHVLLGAIEKPAKSTGLFLGFQRGWRRERHHWLGENDRSADDDGLGDAEIAILDVVVFPESATGICFVEEVLALFEPFQPARGGGFLEPPLGQDNLNESQILLRQGVDGARSFDNGLRLHVHLAWRG